MILLLFACCVSILSFSEKRGRSFGWLDKISASLLVGSFLTSLLWIYRDYSLQIALDANLLLGTLIVAMGCFLLFVQRVLVAPSIVGPIALFFLMRSFFQSGFQGTGIQGSNGLLLNVHILFAVCGQAVALVAPILALFYLVQNYLLKKSIASVPIQGIPSLDLLQTWLLWLLQIGLVLISFALVTGLTYAAQTEAYGALWPKTIWAFTVWCWYIAVLFVRYVGKRPMRDVAAFSIVGAMLVGVGFWSMFYA
jgi:ABC-type uncharacterized transport system permease subunit